MISRESTFQISCSLNCNKANYNWQPGKITSPKLFTGSIVLPADWTPLVGYHSSSDDVGLLHLDNGENGRNEAENGADD